MLRPIALVLLCLMLVAGCTPNERIDVGRRPATARPIASPSEPSREPVGRGVRWESRGTPIGFGHGLVVLGQEIGVRAFPLHCRRPCEPAFTTGLHTYDPALVRHDVAYVGTDRGVAILSLGCSGSCGPIGWLRSGDVADPSFDGYLAEPANRYVPVGIAGGHVLVQVGWDGASGSGVYLSRLAAFPLDCRHKCVPEWTSPLGAGRLPPAVAGGLVLAPRIGRVDAFPAGCARRRCAPMWTGVLYRRPDITWTETPVVAGGLAVVSTNGCVCGADSDIPRVEAFPLWCGTDGATCQPAWSIRLPWTRFNSGLVVHEGVAYVATEGTAARTGTAAVGYPVKCTGTCEPSIQLALGRVESGTAPVFADGSSFVLTRSTNRLLAFRDPCTGSCRPVAAVPLPHAGSGPFIARGSVLVAAGRDLIGYPLEPRADVWRRSWTWRAPFRIEDVRVRGRFAIVWAHNRTIELDLQILERPDDLPSRTASW
ncbi:MAG TPA: hypothetical protein VGJ99_08645 [Actinomycetota bacterium]|jgi:hypothetical protein